MVELDKGTRILDAAEAWLLRVGYRKVSMAEVASRAGVGKGTLYLYWPSKTALFGAVLVRDTVRGFEEQLGALRADPYECLLHRTHQTAYRLIMRRPLARALYTRDHEVLGELLGSGGSFAAGKADTATRYLEVLHRHGLLASEPSPELLFRLSVVTAGAYLREELPGADAFSVDAKASLLATTLRQAFEPPGPPSPSAVRSAAAEVVALYQHWRDELARTLPTEPLET
ncbi:TetR/AcrR family transcriptional regulator [Flindersiella endophytica]